MGEDSLNGTRLNGTIAIYTCMDGFSLDGIGTQTRTCFNGNWTGTEPVCIASKPWTCIYWYYNYVVHLVIIRYI